MLKSDVLVIGSGIAGLTFALKASEFADVLVMTKGKSNETNTSYAQGGIAAAIGENDSYEKHIQDTLQAGDGLCKEDMVEKIIRYGRESIDFLESLGVEFSHRFSSSSDETDLGKEGGHSESRVLFVGDYTGEAIEEALVKAVKDKNNIELIENLTAVDLLTQHHLQNFSPSPGEKPRCWGAYAFDSQKDIVRRILAKYTVLATGGAGRLYKYTTNPELTTGDGIAMAYRAGAWVANLEFLQFHPTLLYKKAESDPFLISEALRGEEAKLKLEDGTEFMKNYHSDRELAPRDVVAQAIDRELKKSGKDCVYLI